MAKKEERKKQNRPAPEAAKSGESVVPGLIAGFTAAWALVVLGKVAGGLAFGRYLDKWLGYDFAVLPSARACAGHAGRLLLAAAMTLVLLGLGRSLLRLLRFAVNNFWEESALSFGLGYGAVGTLLLLLGLCGLWRTGILRGILALLALASLVGLKILWESMRGGPAKGGERLHPDLLVSCAGAFILLLWLYELRYALVPETFYDALVYHLALPAQYLLHGRVYPTPANSFSGIPALPQMLSGAALSLDSWGIVASILHCSLLPWCAIALAGLGRRLGRPQAGIVAAAVFAATPVVIGESFRVSVGLEWALMEACCLTGVLALVEGAGDDFIPASILTGCFLGFAMATKYPAWLLPLAVVAVLATTDFRDPARRARGLKSLAVIAATAAVLLAPWALKNFAFYGNPLYPYFQERIAPASAAMPDWRQLSSAGTDPGRLLTPSGLWAYLTHPWSFLKPTEDVTESMGPVYLALLPALLLFPVDRRGKFLGLFALAAWIPLSFLTLLPRYFIPHLAVLALLTAYLVEGLEPLWNASAFRAGAVLLSFLTAFGWAVMDANRAKLAVYLGTKSFDDYLAHTTVSYPGPPYVAYQFLNEQTPPEARVLVYGEARGYYLKRDAILSSPDQRTALEVWVDQSADADALARRLRQEKVAYIMVNPAELSRSRLAPRVSPAGLRVLDEFWKRFTGRVFGVLDPRDRWVGVYRLLDDAEAARPHPVDDLFGPYLRKSP